MRVNEDQNHLFERVNDSNEKGQNFVLRGDR